MGTVYNKKGFSTIILGIIVAVILAGGIGYSVLKKRATPYSPPQSLNEDKIKQEQSKSQVLEGAPSAVNQKTFKSDIFGLAITYDPNVWAEQSDIYGGAGLYSKEK